MTNKKLVIKIRIQAIARSGGRVYTKLLSSYLVLRLNLVLVIGVIFVEHSIETETWTNCDSNDILEP